ncbi:hypothetical protein TGS27_2204 [Geobacillus stearothermophilus]|uniref:Uncharacterized protein n=1 Tax=Geobacillus stearothermophilus TaxID=1422 RepID=A0A150MB82_GEOSE|nr:hypothetical protein GS8_2739 [Geobacillus stearothermophilus]KYD21502.1 hypothetical protein B4109_2449 [Geobacillus stearothermophilus]OAO79450.1 hypothetical protein TGS27_2204 [Geobacillus stearothermophilus]
MPHQAAFSHLAASGAHKEGTTSPPEQDVSTAAGVFWRERRRLVRWAGTPNGRKEENA